jgi:hypothetical protein
MKLNDVIYLQWSKEKEKRVTMCVDRYTKGGGKGRRYNVKETRG